MKMTVIHTQQYRIGELIRLQGLLRGFIDRYSIPSHPEKLSVAAKAAQLRVMHENIMGLLTKLEQEEHQRIQRIWQS